MQKQLWMVVFRLALGTMWVVAAVPKLANMTGFLEKVKAYQFPFISFAPLDAVVSYSLPAIELIVGVCLIIGIFRLWGYLLSLLMFTAFGVGVGFAKYHGLEIPCGCFGASDAPLSYWHVVGLVAGFASVLFLWVMDRHYSNGGGELKMLKKD